MIIAGLVSIVLLAAAGGALLGFWYAVNHAIVRGPDYWGLDPAGRCPACGCAAFEHGMVPQPHGFRITCPGPVDDDEEVE